MCIRDRATTTGRQRLLISCGGPRDDSERRPAPSRIPGASTTENYLRSPIAPATGTAKLTIGVENTSGKEREVNMSVMLVPGLGRNLLSSSAALANGVETTTVAFPALKAKRQNFPLRADHKLYFLDAIVPELPSEYANVGENVQRNVVASSPRPYQRSKC